MTVDVGLLAALALPLAYAFALMHLVFWRLRRNAVHGVWAAANFCGGLGVTVLVLRQGISVEAATSIGNTLVFGSALVIWAGMARFAGHAVPWKSFAIAAVLFFIAFRGLWTVSDDLGLRVLLSSLGSAAANAGVALELMRGQQTRPLKTRTVLSLVFALHALFFLFRAATALTLDASKDFLQATGIQNLAVTVAAMKMIAWNITAVLMVRERNANGARENSSA